MEANSRIKRAQQIYEHSEINIASLALGDAEDIETAGLECDPPQDACELIDGRINCSPPLRRETLTMVPQATLQHGALGGHLGRNDAANDLVRRLSRDSAPGAAAHCRLPAPPNVPRNRPCRSRRTNDAGPRQRADRRWR